MKMNLRTKTTVGTAAFLIMVMLISTVLVSIIINRQNRGASNDLIEKSFTIIKTTLIERQEKLLIDSRQMATINDMGGTLKFVRDFGQNLSMTSRPLRNMSYDIGQIAMAGDLRKALIYNMDGELVSFAVRLEKNAYQLGFVSDRAKGTLIGTTLMEGKQLEVEDWKELKGLQNLNIEMSSGENILRKETVHFEDIRHRLKRRSMEFNIPPREPYPRSGRS